MLKSNSKQKQGLLLVIIAAFLWGGMSIAAKSLLHSGLKASQLVSLRLAITSISLLVFWSLRDRKVLSPPPKRELFKLFLLGVTGLALNYHTYFLSISKLPVAMGILLQYLSPVFIIVFLAVIRKSLPGIPIIICIFGCLLGQALVVEFFQTPIQDIDQLGVFYGLAAAVTYAYYTLLSGHLLRRNNAWVVQFYCFSFAAVFWIVANPPTDFPSVFDWSDCALILFIALGGTLAPFALFLAGLSRLDASIVGVTTTLEPIFAAFLAWPLLGEHLSSLQILGAALVVLCVALMNIYHKRS